MEQRITKETREIKNNTGQILCFPTMSIAIYDSFEEHENKNTQPPSAKR